MVMTLLHRRILCRWALRISLEASFSSINGAGGFSISPKFEFRAIVPIHSEVSSALSGAEKSLKSRDVSAVIKDAQRALFEAFRGGKASKSDALGNGDTILHVVTRWQGHSYRWDPRSRLTWRSVINSLLQASLSPNRPNDRDQTPADSMIDYIGHEGGDMNKQQVDGRRNDHLFEDFSFRLIWKIADEKGLQDIDLPEEMQPLVYKSGKLLAAQLRKGTDIHRWIESYTRWGPGLALILQSGYTPPVGAVRAACEANYQLCIGIDTLQNVNAYEAYTLLAATSANLEGLSERPRWSVFDCVGVNLDLADQLWDSGFRDVNAIDKKNETCLTKLWENTPPCDLDVFLQKAHWLISKGADIRTTTPLDQLCMPWETV
ncbi:hypothetical protein PENSUB_5382 [Penicillium subrubescens]|uniref:Uncharacterized protein n=1 Tax=Penicillium subrubescens TaxID=1316194 RepID=A0A1Q5UA09_9EURO|nr:hypothetical protein PENSUB_5382 [Penicillium subrubescens]